MKNSMHKMRSEYSNGTWAFISGTNKIGFDQAIVDVTRMSDGVVEGFVVSVHGVDHEIAQWLDSHTKNDMGIRGVHSLGRGPTLRRMRLLSDGTVEQA